MHGLRRSVIVLGALIACAGCSDDAPSEAPPFRCETAAASTFTGVAAPAIDWAIEATGASELLDLTPTADGGALVTGLARAPLALAGQVIGTGAMPTLFTVAVDGDGIGRWHHAIAHGQRLEGAVASPRSDGTTWLVVLTLGDVVLDPGGAARALDLPDDDVTLLVLRVDDRAAVHVATISGELERFALVAAPAAADGLLLAGAGGNTITVTAGDATVSGHATGARSWPGHGWLARLDATGAPRSVEIIDGDAGSVVTGALALADGRIAVSGRFGGFGPLTARFGAGADAPVLESVSSDDDPALDAFVALADTDGRFTWAERIRSYNQSDPVAIAATATGFVAQVVSTGYDTVYAEASAQPVRIRDPHSLGAWTADGRFEWAQATAPYQLLDRHAASVRADGDVWVAQPGAADELRVPLAPDEDWLLAALDDRGTVRGVRHLVVRATTDDRVLTLARPSCGPRWLVAGNPYGRPVLVGRGGDVVLDHDPGLDVRIVIAAVRSD